MMILDNGDTLYSSKSHKLIHKLALHFLLANKKQNKKYENNKSQNPKFLYSENIQYNICENAQSESGEEY